MAKSNRFKTLFAGFSRRQVWALLLGSLFVLSCVGLRLRFSAQRQAEIDSLLRECVITKKIDVARSMLQNGANPNAMFVDRHGEGPSYAIEFLFVHSRRRPPDEESPLTLAVKRRDIQMIYLLFKAGADPNLKTF